MTPLLEIQDLRTSFFTADGEARAVDGVSFTVRQGETMALVGESGSGKSVTSLSILRLFPSPPGRITGGHMMFRDGRIPIDLAQASERQMRRLRGRAIGMIFQEPMTSLNPMLTIGEQVAETLRAHTDLSPRRHRHPHARHAGQSRHCRPGPARAGLPPTTCPAACASA